MKDGGSGRCSKKVPATAPLSVYRMRKFYLTLFLALTFGAYVWYANAQSAKDGAAVAMIAPDSRVLPAPQPSSPAQVDPPQPSVPAANVPTGQPAPVAAPKPIVKPKPAPAPKPVAPPKPRGMYADGTYRGTPGDAYYGYVQVAAVISGGRLADVQILDHPSDRNRSVYINSIAMPALVSEALRAQNAQIDFVSGATDSSMAFRDSLSSALALARN